MGGLNQGEFDAMLRAAIAEGLVSSPIVQGAAVADAAGGAVQDAEARTALNALLARVRALGFIAP